MFSHSLHKNKHLILLGQTNQYLRTQNHLNHKEGKKEVSRGSVSPLTRHGGDPQRHSDGELNLRSLQDRRGRGRVY